MFLFISIIFIITFSLFLWMLLISSKKSITNEEQYIEDNLQMEYLRNFLIRKNCYSSVRIMHEIPKDDSFHIFFGFPTYVNKF